MHKLFQEFDLQFFAGEGASSGDGAGVAPAGVSTDIGAAADAGQRDTLETMGVPVAEVRKYRAMKERQALRAGIPQQTQQAEPQVQDAAAEDNQPQQGTEQPAQQEPQKTLKDALKENSEWNREMQNMVRDRVKNTNTRLDKAMQILELVGRDYGIEADNLADLDLDSLRAKVEGDKSRYEKQALAHGTDVDTEMRLEKLQRENRQQKKELDDRQREAELQNHYRNLQAQARELQKSIPGFNLDRELENREFYERTLPGGRDTVESAYYAIHGKEIAAMRAQQAANAAARGTSQAMANSIKAGRQLPQENGTVQRAPGNIQSKRYSEMTPAERKEWERQARAGKRFG